jgi:hypothetical protein
MLGRKVGLLLGFEPCTSCMCHLCAKALHKNTSRACQISSTEAANVSAGFRTLSTWATVSVQAVQNCPLELQSTARETG